jgi:hypothetical protein
MPTSSFRNDKGAALIEFCLILPVLLILVFAIIDFGRLIHARIIITNVAREGGSIAFREIKSDAEVIKILQSSASSLPSVQACKNNPLDLCGRIYISNITAGLTSRNPYPVIKTPRVQDGNLNVPSGIQPGGTLGLTPEVYAHLVFNNTKKTADINGVVVVETFYRFTPITPLPSFITNLWTGGGAIIGSRAVICAYKGV